MLPIPWVAMTSDKIIAGPAVERAEDLCLLAKLAEEGEFKPVIDRTISVRADRRGSQGNRAYIPPITRSR
jgi:hypothetical protein